MDGASLAVVRIVVGCVGLLSMARLWWYGWVETLYVTDHPLRYPLMGWVPTPGSVGIRLLTAAIAVAALALAVGWRTRLAALVFAVLFGWLEMIEVSTYLNHYWFLTLGALVLCVAPSDTTLALRPRRIGVHPGWVWLMRGQVGVVYCCAAIAKLNADWLMHGTPLRLWLPARSDMPVIGDALEHQATAIVLSWAGLLFDLTVVPLLLWRRSRPLAWAAVIGFHVATWLLFPIGVFPWVMIAMTTVFFAPDWPRRWLPAAPPAVEAAGRAPRRWAVAAWLLLMVALPSRAALIPGDARWTMEGYRFAWNVLLTERGGDLQFRLVDLDTGITTRSTAEALYTPLQWKVMSTEPELIRQAAHVVAAEAADDGRRVAVYADAFVSLNGRAAQRIIDPTVDLSNEPYRPFGQPWILPADG